MTTKSNRWVLPAFPFGPTPEHAPVDWSDPDLDFSRYSSTGVIGDPTHASAELGAKLWEAVVAAVASIFRSVGENDATFGT